MYGFGCITLKDITDLLLETLCTVLYDTVDYIY